MSIRELNTELLDEVCLPDRRWDCHVHTRYASGDKDISPDMTPANILAAAERRGLRGLVFTDHVRASTEWLDKYRQEIAEAARHSPSQAVLGVEGKIREDGTLDIPPACTDGSWWVTASVHTFEGGKDAWLRAIHSALALPYVTALGHLGSQYDGRKALGHICFPFWDSDLLVLGKAIAQSGKLVEINARHGLPFHWWLQAFRAAGVRFCLSSDSHTLATIGRFSGGNWCAS
jgi:histidinol phosphatase-like PHP family hydrolase